MNSFDAYIIPSEILEAATKIKIWADKNNHKDWVVLGVCDRSFADRFIYPENNACRKQDCPNCGNNRQVWRNQLTHKLTCHRVGCNNLELE